MNQIHEFLQSEHWLVFQKSTRKDIFTLSSEDFSSHGIFHVLSWVGKYLYIPRGPILTNNLQPTTYNQQQKENIQKLIEKAKEKNAKWIRIEPENEESLQNIKDVFEGKIVRAPRDVQPKEIFVIDITKDKETLLAQMKPKTRYNIRLAEKRGVKIFTTREEKYKQAFYDLVEKTADRKEINPHSRIYYEKFFAVFPETLCQLFVAEYNGEIVSANILITFEKRAIYLHGGSSDTHRDTMAPFLLQWKQIEYAKEHGCTEYDFGGVHTEDKGQEIRDKREEKTENKKSLTTHPWEGITRFKKGFSPNTVSTVYPGTFDIILDSRVYFLYTTFRAFKNFIQ